MRLHACGSLPNDQEAVPIKPCAELRSVSRATSQSVFWDKQTQPEGLFRASHLLCDG